MKWRPIKTAPKDGSAFLGFVNEKWVEGFFWYAVGWAYLSDGDMAPENYQPTHWMPLPEPPNE